MAIMASAEAAAGALVGWVVDGWAGTYPRWMTIGGAVGIVIGLHAFDFSPSTYGLWKQVGHACVYATLITTVGSCLSYLVKTRQILLQGSH